MTTRSWNISTADAGDSAQGVIVISHASQSDTNAYVVIVTVDLGTGNRVHLLQTNKKRHGSDKCRFCWQ